MTQIGETSETARRYALAGGVIHPYFFVIKKAKSEYESVAAYGKQKDMEDLLNGAHYFREVRAVLKRIHGSEANATAAIRQSLGQIMPTGTRIP